MQIIPACSPERGGPWFCMGSQWLMALLQGAFMALVVLIIMVLLTLLSATVLWCLKPECAQAQSLEQGQHPVHPLRARQVFQHLPPTIFENTAEGLTVEEKYQLVTQGAGGAWVIRESGPDILRVESLGDSATVVLLCLFRNNNQVIAAIGTDVGAMCTLELWNVELTGGLTPISTPPEPDIRDFFAPGTRLPAGITASFPFCVSPEGLEVRALFWTSNGLAHVPVDNDVDYVWQNGRFRKRITPIVPYDFPRVFLPDEPVQETVDPELTPPWEIKGATESLPKESLPLKSGPAESSGTEPVMFIESGLERDDDTHIGQSRD